MSYESIGMIGTYMQWMIAVAIAVIIFRVLYIIFSMYSSADEGISVNVIITKVGKHIKALVLCVIVEAIITLVKSYFFH